MNRLQRVDRSSFTFNTDITSSSANDTCNSGVIHAIKIKDFDDGDGGLLQHEENAIAWVEDANHASVNALIDQLISLDFGEDRMRFIPYSSKAAWSQRYPHAIPYEECELLQPRQHQASTQKNGSRQNGTAPEPKQEEIDSPVFAEGDMTMVNVDCSIERACPDPTCEAQVNSIQRDSCQDLLNLSDPTTVVLTSDDGEVLADVIHDDSRLSIPVASPNLEGNEFHYLVDSFISTGSPVWQICEQI